MKKKLITLPLILILILAINITAFAANQPKVYAEGDSIMEGYRTYGYGVAQNLRVRYGYSVGGDQSKSGSVMYRPDFFWLGQIKEAQTPTIISYMQKWGVDDYTCIVIDGGGNDLTIAVSDPNMTSWLEILKQKTYEDVQLIVNSTGNRPTGGATNIPIFFLYPKLAEGDKQASQKYAWGYDKMIEDEKNVVASFWKYGVYGVDLTSLLTDSDMADDVHPNANGYIKISDYIHFINTINHYNATNVTAPSPTIKYGQTGDNVKQLQQCLNYLGASVLENGVANDETINALRFWQAVSGLNPDGIYGKQSYNVLKTQIENKKAGM